MTHITGLLLLLLVISTGCGQKSEITNAVAAQTMAQQYGDGELTYFPIFMPLTESSIDSFNSPLNKFGFVSGFFKILMDTGAKLGLGKSLLTLVQPIYDFPDQYIKEARIKRVFFYLETEQKDQKRDLFYLLKSLPFVNGRGADNFNFLNQLAVRVSSHEMPHSESWMPIFNSGELGRKEADYLKSIFKKKKQLAHAEKGEETQELLLMKYEKAKKRDYLRKDTGKIYIIKTETPADTRNFLVDHPRLKGYFQSIHLLNKSILVELIRDPVIEEGFLLNMSDEQAVYDLQECNPDNCLDLKVEDVNLVPLLTKGNAIKLETIINADKVPASFQLKGYIEFEVKVKLTF